MIFCNNASLMFMPAEVWSLNQSKNCQNICFYPSKLICIHGKLKKNKFCSIWCYISHLGSLSAISINVLTRTLIHKNNTNCSYRILIVCRSPVSSVFWARILLSYFLVDSAQTEFVHNFRDNAVSGDIPLISPVLESMVPP